MRRLLDLIQSRYCLFIVVYLVFILPVTAQYSTVSNTSDFSSRVVDSQSQEVFNKIKIKSKSLRGLKSTNPQVVAKNELELFYITTLALKITGGINLEQAIESNYHDLIGHARLVRNNVDLELLVFDILSYLL